MKAWVPARIATVTLTSTSSPCEAALCDGVNPINVCRFCIAELCLKSAKNLLLEGTLEAVTTTLDVALKCFVDIAVIQEKKSQPQLLLLMRRRFLSASTLFSSASLIKLFVKKRLTNVDGVVAKCKQNPDPFLCDCCAREIVPVVLFQQNFWYRR